MDDELQREILELKRAKDVLILAHNYQRPEVQEIADHVGDSFELARRAAEADAKIILFCGVDFMAEVAAILNPDKRVLIPAPEARCPMAAMLPAYLVKGYKERYPEAAVAVYINTLAEAKAEADVVFTSSNGVRICSSLPEQEILVGPDLNLARYIQKRLPEKRIIPMPEYGYCYTHRKFKVADLARRDEGMEVMIHPEADLALQERADFVGSTGQMFSYPRRSRAKKFLVGTEVGLIHRLEREYPDREFYPLNEEAVCWQMKKNTLAKVHEALREERYPVEVDGEIAARAKEAIDRMIELGR
ncbi:MAG: quinolinate synthase NadA [Candidatus Bipolaricaulia bacterium]